MNPLLLLVAQAEHPPAATTTGPSAAAFVVFGAFALVGALATVISKSPIRSAVGLFVHVLSLAGLYLTLSAHFLATIQLLIYAGAVVVLFVFVIMLLGPASHSASDGKGLATRLAGVLGMAAIAAVVLNQLRFLRMTPRSRPLEYGTLRQVGNFLFNDAAIPFELVSITLVVAMIGAFTIGRGHHKKLVSKGESASGPQETGPARTTEEERS